MENLELESALCELADHFEQGAKVNIEVKIVDKVSLCRASIDGWYESTQFTSSFVCFWTIATQAIEQANISYQKASEIYNANLTR